MPFAGSKPRAEAQRSKNSEIRNPSAKCGGFRIFHFAFTLARASNSLHKFRQASAGPSSSRSLGRNAWAMRRFSSRARASNSLAEQRVFDVLQDPRAQRQVVIHHQDAGLGLHASGVSSYPEPGNDILPAEQWAKPNEGFPVAAPRFSADN